MRPRNRDDYKAMQKRRDAFLAKKNRPAAEHVQLNTGCGVTAGVPKTSGRRKRRVALIDPLAALRGVYKEIRENNKTLEGARDGRHKEAA